MEGNDDHGTLYRSSVFRYSSLDEMWEAELNGNSKLKITNPIGSKKRWYQLGGQYWDVIDHSGRI